MQIEKKNKDKINWFNDCYSEMFSSAFDSLFSTIDLEVICILLLMQVIGLHVVQFNSWVIVLVIIFNHGFEITCPITPLVITITIFSNLIGALTASFFTNYCVGLKSDCKSGQLAVI